MTSEKDFPKEEKKSMKKLIFLNILALLTQGRLWTSQISQQQKKNITTFLIGIIQFRQFFFWVVCDGSPAPCFTWRNDKRQPWCHPAGSVVNVKTGRRREESHSECICHFKAYGCGWLWVWSTWWHGCCLFQWALSSWHFCLEVTCVSRFCFVLFFILSLTWDLKL